MPIYEYEHDGERGEECPERFEAFQRMSDAPLDRCPACGRPCHRVFSSFAPMRGTQGMFQPKNLERLGFTQYRRAGGGYYEKVCGRGPRTIRGEGG